jgi:hypothetical protein
MDDAENLIWHPQVHLKVSIFDKDYTVRGAYHLLASQVLASMDDAENLIWHPQVHLKVSIFV